LNLTVTPKVAGTFKVRIRGWVTAPDYQNPARDPASGTTDQQNFPVYETTVTVSGTPIIRIDPTTLTFNQTTANIVDGDGKFTEGNQLLDQASDQPIQGRQQRAGLTSVV